MSESHSDSRCSVSEQTDFLPRKNFTLSAKVSPPSMLRVAARFQASERAHLAFRRMNVAKLATYFEQFRRYRFYQCSANVALFRLNCRFPTDLSPRPLQVTVSRSRIGKATPAGDFPVSHRGHVHPVAMVLLLRFKGEAL
jgi:hypothetical protein